MTWRPWWQMLIYGALLGAGSRFIHFSLFDGVLLSPAGYLIDSLVLIGIGLTAYRLTQAHKMVFEIREIYTGSQRRTETGYVGELLDLLGIPAAMLPDVRDSAGDYGETRSDLSGEAH